MPIDNYRSVNRDTTLRSRLAARRATAYQRLVVALRLLLRAAALRLRPVEPLFALRLRAIDLTVHGDRLSYRAGRKKKKPAP